MIGVVIYYYIVEYPNKFNNLLNLFINRGKV